MLVKVPLPHTKLYLMFFRAVFRRLQVTQNPKQGFRSVFIVYRIGSWSGSSTSKCFRSVSGYWGSKCHIFKKNQIKASLNFIVLFIRTKCEKEYFWGRFHPFFPDLRALFETWILIRLIRELQHALLLYKEETNKTILHNHPVNIYPIFAQGRYMQLARESSYLCLGYFRVWAPGYLIVIWFPDNPLIDNTMISIFFGPTIVSSF